MGGLFAVRHIGIGNVHALTSAFLAHWRFSTKGRHGHGAIVIQFPTVVVLTWIAADSGDPAILAYVLVGAPMMLVRENSAFFVPLALFRNVRKGTAEMTMVARTPLSVVILGKSLSVATLGQPTACSPLSRSWGPPGRSRRWAPSRPY